MLQLGIGPVIIGVKSVATMSANVDPHDIGSAYASDKPILLNWRSHDQRQLLWQVLAETRTKWCWKHSVG